MTLKTAIFAGFSLFTLAFVSKNNAHVPRSYNDTPKQYNFRFDGQSLSWIDAVLVKSYNSIGLEMSRAKSDSLRTDISMLVMYFRDQRHYQDTLNVSTSGVSKQIVEPVKKKKP